MKMLCWGRIFPGYTAGTTCELHIPHVDATANKWPGQAVFGGTGFDGDRDDEAKALFDAASAIVAA